MNAEASAAQSNAPAKLGLLGSLYFSQGLPFGFFMQALPVLLRRQGLSLGEIGLTSLLALPWALKFLWAPAVDRYPAAGGGRQRKSWIVPLQLAAVVILTGLGCFDIASSTASLMGAVVLLNLIAATQDVATDGLAVDLLAPSERGFADGIQVAGYRVGMIVGGGALLVLHRQLGDSGTFLAMAALTALATLPVAFAREPTRRAVVDRQASVARFLKRAGSGWLLVLIVVYKAGDAFATGMLRPFFVDAGLSLADVGWLLGTVGFVAGLFGAIAGGALINRLGRRHGLVLFALLQALAVAGYAYLARATPDTLELGILCGAEHFAGGMATAALFTCMMDWCSPETAATDYTIQASAVVIATGAASALAGFSAQAFGYFAHFCLATGLALIAPLVAGRCFVAIERARGLRDDALEALPCT